MNRKGLPSFDINIPVAGFYKTKLVRGGPWVPVYLWFGCPHDPDTGEELDRSPRWQAERLGRLVPVDAVWPFCALHPIDQAEHNFLLADHRWHVQYKPDAPQAMPRSKIDLTKLPPIY